MDDDPLESRINAALRELGMSDDEIAQIEVEATRIREARKKVLEDMRREKGEDVVFVAEMVQRLYAVMTAGAQLASLLTPEQEARGKTVFDTLTRITGDMVSRLGEHFKVSEADMDDIIDMGEAVVTKVLSTASEAATDKVMRRAA